MRLRNIDTMEVANGFLPCFIESDNKWFVVLPRDSASAFRPWAEAPEALDDGLARREEWTLSKAPTFSAAATKYCVRTDDPGTALRGAKVTLLHNPGGRLAVHYKGRVLSATTYGYYPVPDQVEDEKTLNVRVDAIVAKAAAEPLVVPLGGDIPIGR